MSDTIGESLSNELLFKGGNWGITVPNLFYSSNQWVIFTFIDYKYLTDESRNVI